MDDYTPVIKTIRHDQQFDTTGRAMPIVVVQYMVGTQGPFWLRLQEADFNAPKIQELMNITANTLRALGATTK